MISSTQSIRSEQVSSDFILSFETYVKEWTSNSYEIFWVSPPLFERGLISQRLAVTYFFVLPDNFDKRLHEQLLICKAEFSTTSHQAFKLFKDWKSTENFSYLKVLFQDTTTSLISS